jgi:Predicted transcriptional regulator
MLDDPEHLAQIFSALSTQRRIKTLEGLIAGKTPTEIADDLNVSRPTIQPYLNDFRELNWIEKTGRSFSITAQGNAVYDTISALDQSRTNYEELQQFLKDNPGVVPAEVLDELRDN